MLNTTRRGWRRGEKGKGGERGDEREEREERREREEREEMKGEEELGLNARLTKAHLLGCLGVLMISNQVGKLESELY